MGDGKCFFCSLMFVFEASENRYQVKKERVGFSVSVNFPTEL